MYTIKEKSFIVICILSLCMFQVNSYSKDICGAKYTGDLCEQILLNPDILQIINKDKAIRSELFGHRVFISDIVYFIKLHFSPECIDRAGCRIYGNNDLIEYQYYGGYCYYPVSQSVKKAYLRFVFRKENGRWVLVSIQNLPVQKYPFHDSDWDGVLKK
ncbi:MAG: hypothetical protein U0264_12065 [Candidatus Kapaibacterium sp.]